MTRPTRPALGALAVALGAAGLAPAQSPAVAVTPVAAVVPVYTAVYLPDDGRDRQIAELLAELRQLRAEVGKLRKAPAEAGAAGPDPLAVARSACAACHTPGRAEESGGGFVLLAGDGSAFSPLTPRDRQRVRQRVQSGAMPPPPAKLSPAEASALAAWAGAKPD